MVKDHRWQQAKEIAERRPEEAATILATVAAGQTEPAPRERRVENDRGNDVAPARNSKHCWKYCHRDQRQTIEHNLASSHVEASVRYLQDVESAFRVIVAVKDPDGEKMRYLLCEEDCVRGLRCAGDFANVVPGKLEHLVATVVHHHSSHGQCKSARFFIDRFRRSGHGIWIGSHVQQRWSGMRKGPLNRRREIGLVLDAFGVETDGSCDGAGWMARRWEALARTVPHAATVRAIGYLRRYSFELTEAGGASFESACPTEGPRVHTTAITVSTTNMTSTSHSLVSADIVVTSLAARPFARVCHTLPPYE